MTTLILVTAEALDVHKLAPASVTKSTLNRPRYQRSGGISQTRIAAYPGPSRPAIGWNLPISPETGPYRRECSQ